MTAKKFEGSTPSCINDFSGVGEIPPSDTQRTRITGNFKPPEYKMPRLEDAKPRPKKLTLEQLDDITRMNHDKIIKIREKFRSMELRFGSRISQLNQRVKKLEK